jgi:Ser/Thr protein kinase RdoA (MazF antagonist)
MENMPDDKLTIFHFDLRADNMFFDWDTPEDPLVVFDWATLGIGRGARDLSVPLGLSMATELRRQVEKDIVKVYHQRLLDRGISGYSFDECWTDYLRGLLQKTLMPIATFSRLDLSDPRAKKLANVATHRVFSAVLDNQATSLLP